MESLNKKTYAQQLILAKIAEKKEQEITNQSWEEYEEFYNDYSDSHSDYYDSAEGELAFIEKIKQESRRYAKRQITWFKAIPNIIWLNAEDGVRKNIEIILEETNWKKR